MNATPVSALSTPEARPLRSPPTLSGSRAVTVASTCSAGNPSPESQPPASSTRAAISGAYSGTSWASWANDSTTAPTKAMMMTYTRRIVTTAPTQIGAPSRSTRTLTGETSTTRMIPRNVGAISHAASLIPATARVTPASPSRMTSGRGIVSRRRGTGSSPPVVRVTRGSAPPCW